MAKVYQGPRVHVLPVRLGVYGDYIRLIDGLPPIGDPLPSPGPRPPRP